MTVGSSHFCPPVIGVSGLIELVDWLLKDGEDCVRGITGLELCGEWMRKEVLLCALFVCFQGAIENLLELRG